MNFKFTLFILGLSWLFCEAISYSIEIPADKELSGRAEDGSLIGNALSTIGKVLNPANWFKTLLSWIPSSIIETIVKILPSSLSETILKWIT